MTAAETRLGRRNWKERNSDFFLPADFMTRRVASLVPDLSGRCNPIDGQAEIVRSKSNNRGTARYIFGSVVVYGKFYFDNSLGRATHNSLTQLWKRGFAAGSGLEVPEPLGFIEEANLLVMRQADGIPLSEFACTNSIDDARAATRLAARWLAKYHATEIPGLPVQSPCEQIEILNIAETLAKTAAQRPHYSPLLIGMLHDLHAAAPKANSSSPLVPVHGQFRPAHVFTDGKHATVIDIEKICLSDPAKDVARFVHVLKKNCFEEGSDRQRTGELIDEFIAEYRELAPSNSVNLSYFRALLAFKALAKLVKSDKLGEGEREAIGGMYRREFEYLVHGTVWAASLSMQQPSVPTSISATEPDKESLARKALKLTNQAFIEARILPLVPSHSNWYSADCRCQIVQNTGTGRLTLRYEFGPDNVLFAKLYCDNLGPSSYEVNRALWEAGFNADERYQVPRPVAFLSDHNLLLTLGVPGTPLRAAFDGHVSVDLVAGSREAANWLAALHRCSLKMGVPEPDWDSLKLFRMGSRLIKAAAARAEQLDMLRELFGMLESRVATLPATRPFVFTHGRYHHDHVFLSGGATAVIDLDRCRPSDPAKDAAEFIRVLRMTAFKRAYDMNRAEEATTMFLNTYLAEIPEAGASLGCYWAAFVFHSLLSVCKKGSGKGTRSWDELMEFYVTEMRRALAFAQ